MWKEYRFMHFYIIEVSLLSTRNSKSMNKQCPRCSLNNSRNAKSCVKCLYDLKEFSTVQIKSGGQRSLFATILKRAVICLIVCVLAVAGFYFSLILSATPLNTEQQASVDKAISILEEKGFDKEAFYLRNLAVFRSNDHWLNASVEKENAYAATNYPLEIMTIYPDFFTYTDDDTERAAILLHEAKHLQGFDEPAAYDFVWKNRKRLGWTKEKYNSSMIWSEVRKQTREFSPNLFICDFNEFSDCTE